ncbi:MAG: AAA family ATPase [Parasporobacterium sp.]|nr:AAA family ATPase [Parasporobacterium sp.]
MDFLTGVQAAEILGITPRRVQQLCKNGQLKGAQRVGKIWNIPRTSVYAEKNHKKSHKRTVRVKPLPIGISDYRRACTEYYYVDKTLLIRDFLDSRHQVSLITRPHSFGKSLNMDMLKVFFEKTEEDTSPYFRNRLIWTCGEQYTSFQGKYPVIYITLKDVIHSSWEAAFGHIRSVIAAEYHRHNELENRDFMAPAEHRKYQETASEKATDREIADSLKYLSTLLERYHGKRVIIIIDEYDTPILNGRKYGFESKITDLLRSMFSAAFKDNRSLEYGFITGIYNGPCSTVFQGLSNLKTSTILEDRYGEYFGLTKSETVRMLEYYGCPDNIDEVREWYGGYRFGDTRIYNPWSVMNYIEEGCFARPYQKTEGDSDTPWNVFADPSAKTHETLCSLLRGETRTVYVDQSVSCADYPGTPVDSTLGSMLFAGRLKVTRIYPQTDGGYICDVSIPNKELLSIFSRELLRKTTIETVRQYGTHIRQAIFLEDYKRLKDLLEQYIRDAVKEAEDKGESLYNILTLGCYAIVTDSYRIFTDRKAGTADFNLALVPLTAYLPGFIYRIREAASPGSDLRKLAAEAVDEIDTAGYYSEEMNEAAAGSIIETGAAYCKGVSELISLT